MLYLDIKNQNLVSGVFKIFFKSTELSFNRAEEKMTEQFNYIKSILDLIKLKIDPDWKDDLEPLRPKPAKFQCFTSIPIKGDILFPNAQKVSNKEISSLETIFARIKQNQITTALKLVLNLINLKTSRSSESFFNHWISFNIVYSELTSIYGYDTQAIEKFSKNYPSDLELKQLLLNHKNTICKLSKANLMNRCKTCNFSKTLSIHLEKNNDRQVWKYTLLCINKIRNNLFHKGKEYQDLSNTNLLLRDTIICGFHHLL